MCRSGNFAGWAGDTMQDANPQTIDKTDSKKCPSCGARHPTNEFEDECPTCGTPVTDLFKFAAGIEEIPVAEEVRQP
jgi:Zn finger protein HypA/HybF involved in hydrogenase expression